MSQYPFWYRDEMLEMSGVRDLLAEDNYKEEDAYEEYAARDFIDDEWLEDGFDDCVNDHETAYGKWSDDCDRYILDDFTADGFFEYLDVRE